MAGGVAAIASGEWECIGQKYQATPTPNVARPIAITIGVPICESLNRIPEQK